MSSSKSTIFRSDFAEFLQVIDNQKGRAAQYDDESDMGAVLGF